MPSRSVFVVGWALN